MLLTQEEEVDKHRQSFHVRFTGLRKSMDGCTKIIAVLRFMFSPTRSKRWTGTVRALSIGFTVFKEEKISRIAHRVRDSSTSWTRTEVVAIVALSYQHHTSDRSDSQNSSSE